jgi:hypothetical protein
MTHRRPFLHARQVTSLSYTGAITITSQTPRNSEQAIVHSEHVTIESCLLDSIFT